jgi:hypothetical protein
MVAPTAVFTVRTSATRAAPNREPSQESWASADTSWVYDATGLVLPPPAMDMHLLAGAESGDR